MAEEELAVQGGRHGGWVKIIILLVLVVVVLGGGAFGLKVLAPGLIPGWGEKPQNKDKEAPKAADKIEPGVLQEIKPFIVNLADASGKRYLKLSLSLELDNPEVVATLNKRMPQIRDSLLILLSSLTFDDINTVEGKMRLRTQVVNRCNTFLDGKVRNIYFTEFVVQ